MGRWDYGPWFWPPWPVANQPLVDATGFTTPNVPNLSMTMEAYNDTPVINGTVYPSLTEAARHHRIDLVNVFRNSADVPPIVTEAIAIGAQAIWMQMGVMHDLAAQEGRSAGLQVVQNKCLMVEHRRSN